MDELFHHERQRRQRFRENINQILLQHQENQHASKLAMQEIGQSKEIIQQIAHNIDIVTDKLRDEYEHLAAASNLHATIIETYRDTPLYHCSALKELEKGLARVMNMVQHKKGEIQELQGVAARWEVVKLEIERASQKLVDLYDRVAGDVAKLEEEMKAF